MQHESNGQRFIAVRLDDFDWFRELPNGAFFALMYAQERIDKQERARTREDRRAAARPHPWDQEMAEAFGWPSPLEDETDDERG
jgi:hypothetical protein